MSPTVRNYLELHRWEPPIDLNVDEHVVGESRYAVWLADFPNCIAQGPTLRTALQRLLSVAPGYLEEMVKAGIQLPSKLPAVTILATLGIEHEQVDPAIVEDSASQARFQGALEPAGS